MTFARPGLIVVALSLMASAALADDQVSPAERLAAIQRMQAWTRLSPRAIVGVTPEIAVALIGRGAPGPKSGQITGVEVQGEVLDEGLIQTRGWRSMRLKLDIACPDRSTWVRQMQVYDGHNRAGAGRDNPVPSGWVRPKAEASLGQVVAAVCGPTSETTVAITQTPPPPRPPSLRPPSLRPPSLRPPSLREASLPTAASPASQPQVNQAHASPPPPGRAPAPPPIRLALRGITTAPSLSGVTVQIAAAPTEGEARRALAGPATGLMLADPNLIFRVDQGEVAGRVVYRAVIAGFSDRKAALDWCESLRKAGDACFVR